MATRKTTTKNKAGTKGTKPKADKPISGSGVNSIEVDLTFSVKGTITQKGELKANLGPLGGMLASVMPMFQDGFEK